MAEHGSAPAPKKGKTSGGHKKEIVQGFTEGMYDMMDSSGFGVFREVPNTIAHLFGAEGSKSGGGGYHK